MRNLANPEVVSDKHPVSQNLLLFIFILQKFNVYLQCDFLLSLAFILLFFI